jgi:hypothetical protein
MRNYMQFKDVRQMRTATLRRFRRVMARYKITSQRPGTGADRSAAVLGRRGVEGSGHAAC